jgi:hypothetical protein
MDGIRKRRQLTSEEKFQIYNEATTEISLALLHMGVLPQIGLFFLNVDH